MGPSSDRERLNFLKLNILKIVSAVLAPEEAKTKEKKVQGHRRSDTGSSGSGFPQFQ